MNRLWYFQILFIVMAMFISVFTFAEEENVLPKIAVEDILILKISAKDERAVMKAADQKLLLLKVGDHPGENLTVMEIAEGRVVFEDVTDKGVETVIIRLENGTQHVERITKITKEREHIQGSTSTGGSSDSNKAVREQRIEEAE